MSPHGIAGHQNQLLPNSWNKCQLARPPTLPNFVALDQTMHEKTAIKFLNPSTYWHLRGNSWAKFHQPWFLLSIW